MSQAEKRILIIGAGVSGLTCAFSLQQRGYPITIIAEATTHKTTSAVAGALWELPPPVCGYPQNFSLKAIAIDQERSIVSYHKFLSLALMKETGVYMRPVNFYFEYMVEDNPIENQKKIEAKNKLLNFRHDPKIIIENGIDSKIYKDSYSYLTPMIDTDKYLNWLFAKVCSDLRTRVFIQKIDHKISDIEEDLLKKYCAKAIVNCAGLGSSELTNDDSIYGVRGGLIYVENEGKNTKMIQQAHCTSLHNISESEGSFIFILPRGENRLVLGGVAEPGKYDLNVTPESYPPYEAILKSCKKFLPDLNNLKILDKHPLSVAVRPFREKGLCLERDPNLRVVHNYGHGGAGVLLSWGCAEEVASLVEELF
jgi:D-amino-acid oxidase